MKKKGTAKIFYTLFFGASVFLMLFILLEFRQSYFAVAASGIVFLIAGYLLLNCLEKEKKSEQQLQESLDNMMKVQKALYVATKKNGELLKNLMEQPAKKENVSEELLTLLQTISEKQEQQLLNERKNAEVQVNALKTVAKYNKENARQLAVNANENAERIIGSLKNMASSITHNLEESMEITLQGVEERYQGMSDVMLANTLTMTERLESVVGNVEQMKESEAVTEESVELPLDVESEIELETKKPVELEIEEPMEEPMELPELEVMPELEPEAEESEKEVEEAPEEENPAPVLSGDPNRAMSADEIAALIASMGGDSPAEEPEEEAEPEEIAMELPELEPEVVELEKPVEEAPEEENPAPVLSGDPNRAMSADEIAALIASMGQ